MKRILRPALYVVAIAYFMVDAIFMLVAKPVSDWLARHWVLLRLRSWIASLRPYPALVLLAVPFAILEPVKPLAAYIAATGHVLVALAILIVGELLKLVLVERLFSVTKPKLLTIPAFAWGYGKWRQAREWLESTEAWRTVRRIGSLAVQTLRNRVAHLRPSRTRRMSWQSR